MITFMSLREIKSLGPRGSLSRFNSGLFELCDIEQLA